MRSRPNVIYLHSHDTGRRISPYGYAVHTPNLQRLAESAMLFRQAFSCAPTCSPSRAGLLTGQAAHSAGMLGLHHRGFRLSDPRQHLCHTMRDVGYSTTLIGVNHIAADVAEVGYDRVVPTTNHSARHVGPAAAAYLREAASASQPFFLDVGFVETHRGRFPHRHSDENPNYARPPSGIVDESRTREDAALFASAVRLLDEGVGHVMNALVETGLDRETLIICTTDHGISFPRHKCSLYDGGLEVMLMLRGPATPTLAQGIGGGVSDTLVSQIDLFPTLCDYLDIARPNWLQGQTLMPVLKAETNQVNHAIFGEITYHAAYQPERALRTQRYKYIRRFGTACPQPLSNIDDGLTKDVWFENDYATKVRPKEEFYDLVFDPGEQCNLVNDAALSTVIDDCRSRLLKWMAQTSDPLLSGDVALPEGAVANSPEDYSAKDVLPQKKDQHGA